jgi:hypothetical protein
VRISGIDIVVSQHLHPVPRMELSRNVPCSDKFRAEFNQWLLEFFGTREPYFQFPGGVIYTTQKGLDELNVSLTGDKVRAEGLSLAITNLKMEYLL